MEFACFIRDNAASLMAGVLLTFVSSVGQTFFISIFAAEIRGEFGLTHGTWGTIYAVGTMSSAAVMIWVGGLTDLFRVRVLSIAVLIGLALASFGMAVNSAVLALPVIIFALRLTGQGMASHIATVAMARWFIAARGRALAIAGLGFAMGEALLPLIFVALMGYVSWRALWIVAAAAILLLLPILLRLLREERTPEAMADVSHAVGMGGIHWARGAVLRHWLFWVMVPAVLGPSAFGTSFFFHQVHFAEVKGWSHIELVALFPAYTVTSIGAMMVSGWAIDRFGTGWLMPLAQLPVAAAFLVFSVASTPALAAIGFVLMAVTTGANATLSGSFWAEFYGTRHLGAIRAMAMAVMVLGSAIGPGLTGALIDSGRAFPDQMTGIAIWFVVVAVIAFAGIARARKALPRSAQIDVIGP